MCISKSRSLVAALVATFAIAISALAIAGQCPGTRADDAGLDLSTRSGLTMLYHRLQDAAMMTCDPSGRTRVLPYFNRPESGDCYSDTLYTLLLKYENSALYSIHDELRLEPIIID